MALFFGKPNVFFTYSSNFFFEANGKDWQTIVYIALNRGKKILHLGFRQINGAPNKICFVSAQ